jgi:rhamnulose-1-phosphate aldolase
MNEIITEKAAPLLHSLSNVAQLIFNRGWAEGTAGNISINVTGLFKDSDFSSLDQFSRKIKFNKTYPSLANRYFLITLSGSRVRDIAKNSWPELTLIKILSNGNECECYFEETAFYQNKRPSSELPTHLAIHNLPLQGDRTANAIIHAHVTELIALTHIPEFKNADVINKLLWSLHPEVKVFIPKGVGFIPYALPGTETIAEKTIKAFHDHDLVIWEKHGVFALGHSLDQTCDTIEIAAKAAQIYFLCLQAGFQPQGLSENDIRELADTLNASDTMLKK